MNHPQQNAFNMNASVVAHISDLDINTVCHRVNLTAEPTPSHTQQTLYRVILAVALALSSPLMAQGNNTAKVLERYAGTWDTTIEWSGPGVAEPIKWDGESTTELIGDNWVASRHLGDYLGMDYDASESMGFDQKKNAWTSIWVDRMQNYVQVMEGSVTAGGGLEFSGKVFDEDTDQWLSVVRIDEWNNDAEYISRFIKKNPEGEVIETLIVTHTKQAQDAAAKPQS